MTKRAENTLEYLEHHLALDFVQSVSKALRGLNDAEINHIYLMSHTASNSGELVGSPMETLLPLIDREAVLRRDISIVPNLGPVLAPELYRKGGAHDLPF